MLSIFKTILTSFEMDVADESYNPKEWIENLSVMCSKELEKKPSGFYDQRTDKELKTNCSW